MFAEYLLNMIVQVGFHFHFQGDTSYPSLADENVPCGFVFKRNKHVTQLGQMKFNFVILLVLLR